MPTPRKPGAPRKPRKRKPSFDVPEGASETATGWVYRSAEPSSPLPVIDTAPVRPPETVPPPPGIPALTRTIDWVSRPMQIGLVLGLAPLRWIGGSRSSCHRA
jgi:hypothetical protein